MLPFLHQPAIYWQLQQLAHAGIEEVILCVDQDSADLLGYLERFHYPGLTLHVHVEQNSMGTGGCLREVHSLIGEEEVLVINNTLFYYDSLRQMIDTHHEKDAEVSLGVTTERRLEAMFGTVIAFPQGQGHQVQGFEAPGVRVPRSVNERYLLRGVYLFSPMALGLLEAQTGYFDIKEQFLPLLQQANTRIHPFEMEGEIRNLHRPGDYAKLTADFLARKPCWLTFPANFTEIVKGIFLHGEAEIAPTANLIGPLWIEHGCRIARGAQVIGPTVLGADCRIQEDAMVIESILWADATISADASVRRAIVCSGSTVPQGTEVEEAIIIPDTVTPGELALIGPQLAIRAALDNVVSATMYRQARFYQSIKRGIDFSAALVGLLVLLPVLLLVALMVKLESRGPLFFRQLRVGRQGKEFLMVKFRTMIPDAENLYNDKEFHKNNEVDGPVFKIKSDPRVTRVGRFLRGASLDELPQLWNVLMGGMSLVGPRPLARHELRLCSSWTDSRLSVRPGITGPWQIWGRRSASFNDWLVYDLMYLKKQSLRFDFYLLYKTVVALTQRTGT